VFHPYTNTWACFFQLCTRLFFCRQLKTASFKDVQDKQPRYSLQRTAEQRVFLPTCRKSPRLFHLLSCVSFASTWFFGALVFNILALMRLNLICNGVAIRRQQKMMRYSWLDSATARTHPCVFLWTVICMTFDAMTLFFLRIVRIYVSVARMSKRWCVRIKNFSLAHCQEINESYKILFGSEILTIFKKRVV